MRLHASSRLRRLKKLVVTDETPCLIKTSSIRRDQQTTEDNEPVNAIVSVHARVYVCNWTSSKLSFGVTVNSLLVS